MKHVPGKKQTTRMTREQLDQMARKDKRKVILMAVGFVVLLGAFLFTTVTAKQRQAEEEARMAARLAEENAAPDVQVFVPDFPQPEVLESIEDKTKEGRILLDEEAILATLKYVQKLTPAQLDSKGLRDYSLDDLDAMTANPDAYRLQALRARGKIIDIRHRPGTETTPGTFIGTLENQRGERAHFVVSGDNENQELGSEFVRVDGLFVQMYETEIDRWWTNGPLIVARSLTDSYAPIVLNQNLDTPAVEVVRDDKVGEVWEFPQLAQWQLMAKAEQGEGRIDWEAAPVLNDELIGRMVDGDDSLRGQPFRIPIKRNMGTRTVQAGENPFYRDEMMQGWMGDFTSRKGNGLLRWVGAFDKPELHDFEGQARLVTGRGFFLKMWIYEDTKGNPSKVPFFVMQSVDVHTPAPDMSHTKILWAMLGLTGIMVLVIAWLLARDKRQTEALQKRLMERRRARRERTEAGSAS